jgi:thermostable 8-oxoguanine DNA glycosylase
MDLPCVRSARVPDAEVIPGVKWGRPEWVPSAAYWAAMSEIADDSDDFVSTETTLKEQVGFCLLGGFGITAEMNHAIFDRLDAEGIFRPHNIPTAADIERLLRSQVNVEGKLKRYRFPNQRSSRLATAMRLIEEDPPSPDDPRTFRDELIKIPGIGPKTASWITRNWLGSDDVAILDIHIIRAGVLIGLFDRRQTVPKDYDAMEARFLEFAAALQVRPSLLDAVMWREMRQLGRGPV